MRRERLLALVIALCMTATAITFPAIAEETGEAVAEKVFYVNDFSKSENIERLGLSNCVEPNISVSDDGKSVLRLENTVGTNSNASGFFYLGSLKGEGKNGYISITGAPELVFEYKVRASKNAKTNNYFGTRDASELAACIVNGKLLTRPNVKVSLTELNREEWNTVTVTYSNTGNTRKVYLNGQFIAEVNEEMYLNPQMNPDYTKTVYKPSVYSTSNYTQFRPHFIAYCVNLGDYYEVDYVKLYKASDSLSVEKVETYDRLDELYVDFDSTVFNVSADMFSIDGVPAVGAELVDNEENIVKVTLEEELDYLTEYTLSVDGVSNIAEAECNQEVSFTTRDKMFRTVGISLVDMMENPVDELYSGDFVYNATFSNDFDEARQLYLYGVQYEKIETDKDGNYVDGGFINKEEIISEEVIAEKGNTNISKDVFIDVDIGEFSSFAWQGKDIPVPVSPVYNFADKATELSYGYLDMPESDKTPVITAEITENYDGLNVKVETGENDSRTVGLLVKHEGELEYVANKKSENGAAEFFVPLHQQQVGYYSVSAGVEKGKYSSLAEDIEFYSPSYINVQTEEKINSEEADNTSAASYINELGEYLGMDMEGLASIEDKERVYTTLFNLRALQEGTVFADYEAVVKAVAPAVKMAKLYEGKDGASIIEESDDLGISERTLDTFKNTLSTDGKQYVASKLKGVSYDVPADMQEDLAFHTVIGAVYKAPHYSNVDTIIGEYGDEIGIKVSSYNALKYPNKVASSLIGKEFASYDAFKEAANTAIANQARVEANTSSKPSGGGGGGGGGRVSSNQKYPTVEEKKEEVKEEVTVKSYSDVKESDWFYSDVMWATEKGMFIGTSETTFTPGMNLTWEQISIVLGRIGHTLENKNGSADISRGDFAEVLYNFLADKNVYPTRDEWIAGTKIFIGDQNGDMMFEKTLTRAECCTVLRRIESK